MLREAEQHWRSIVEAVPQHIWTTDAAGEPTYFNPQVIAFAGTTEQEIFGAGYGSPLIHPDDQKAVRRAWRDAMENGLPFRLDHRARNGAGVDRWLELRSMPLRDDVGRITRWVGIATDVTERKVLEKEARSAKELLVRALEEGKMYLFQFELEGGRIDLARNTIVNVWSSLGFEAPPSARPFAETLAVLVLPEDQAMLAEAVRAAIAGETPAYEVEYRARHADGTIRWNLARGTVERDKDGTPVRFMGSSVDVTALKRGELELQQAKKVAENANRAKDEFLANVSHEIRTPMNAILGMTELALDSPLSEHQRQLLTPVKSAADKLLHIINDLLDFSKIEAGKLELDVADFCLRTSIEDTVGALAMRAHRKGLELICHVRPDVPDALIGDSGRLRQVLMNLVGNAVKFTERGEVFVEVAALAFGVDIVDLRITVRDTGIGVRSDKQADIFRAFEQEDAATTRKYGGTGLGLTISAQLIALMGGNITVESTQGRGSTFSATARFRRSTRAAPRREGPTIEDLEGLRVLVVDDNLTNRRILEEWLTSWRMRPLTVGNAAAAMDALGRASEEGAPYAVVILDARMPDVDGFALAALIREQAEPSVTRIILLSSDHRFIERDRTRKLGISAQLLKPAKQSKLLDALCTAMRSLTDDATERSAESQRPHSARVQLVAPLRILAAEDNELTVALLEQLFTRRGHRAHFARDGQAALAMATAGTFDVMLLDVHMPEMDGFDVARAIREHERTTGRHLPIIAFTARSTKRDQEQCLAAGMDDYLTKPIVSGSLWATIDRVLAVAKPPERPQGSLLDREAIQRASGGEPAILARLCKVFLRSVPAQMDRVRAALLRNDAPQLREGVHAIYGTLAAFSSIGGAAASSLEDLAAQGDLEGCRTAVSELSDLCNALIVETQRLLDDDSVDEPRR